MLATSGGEIVVDGRAYPVAKASPEEFEGFDLALFAGTEGEKGAAVTLSPGAMEREARVGPLEHVQLGVEAATIPRAVGIVAWRTARGQIGARAQSGGIGRPFELGEEGPQCERRGKSPIAPQGSPHHSPLSRPSTASTAPSGSTPKRFFDHVRSAAFTEYYARPETWASLGYKGPPQPLGFMDFTQPPGG